MILITKKSMDKILLVCKDESEKNQVGIKLFAFILYFYYEYVQNDFLNEVKNENPISKKYINKVLLLYNYLFTKTKLEKKK